MHATDGQDGQEQQLDMFGDGRGTSSASDVLASQRQIAFVFDMSPSAVARWPISPVRRLGRESLFSVRDACRHRFATDGRLDGSHQKARLLRGQADKQDLDNATRAKQLIDVRAAMDVFAAQIVVAKNQLLALGSKLAFELCHIARAPSSDSHKFAELIDREVRQILEELSAPRAAAALDLPVDADDCCAALLELAGAGEDDQVVDLSPPPPATTEPTEAPTPTKRRRRTRKAASNE